MLFAKNSDEGVFSPHFTGKSIIRLRSHPSSTASGPPSPQVGKAWVENRYLLASHRNVYLHNYNYTYKEDTR